MCPAGQAFDALLHGHGVVTGVVVGHQVAAIAVEQAQRHLLRTAGGVVEEDHRSVRWAAGLHPHPGLRAGIATRLVQHLQAGFVAVQYRVAEQLVAQQVEQRL
ncbi:hypothetical protein D3C78_1533190 [compost metagenome]